MLYSKSSIGRPLSDDINIETDNFDNGVYWITPSTLGNPSGSYGRLVKMDNYKMFVSAIATSGIYYARELWVSIYANSTWTPFNGFSDDATLFAGKAIQSGDDLNDYTMPGIYYSGSSSITTSLLNIPETFSAGFSMLVLPISTTMRIQIIYRGGSENSMYVRPFINDWGSWSKYIGTVISS